jgi:DNA-binding GntR family transcriptional regulator
MARRENAETISGEVRELLRADIFAGVWPPGTRLQIGALTERYGASSTVVREAMVRLGGERLLEFRPNRGFFVAEYTLDELRSISELRCRVEEYGLELAIERGDMEWESELIAVHHRLERTPRRAPDDPHHVSPEWFTAHRAFHVKLLEAGGVPLILDIAGTLSDATSLYRLWTAPDRRAESRDIEAEHRAILEATIARDGASATRLLREHYTRTLEVIEQAEFGIETRKGA